MTFESDRERKLRNLMDLFGPEGLSRAKVGYVVRPAGATIVSQGDVDDRLYIILRGRVAVTKLLRSGDERFVRELGTGQYFGELSAFDPAPRSATVRSLEESEFIVIARQQLLTVLTSNQDLALHFLADFARRIRDDESRLDIRMPVSERLKGVLGNLGGAPMADGSRLVSIARRELAARCHADEKTISRELTKLERSGVISREGRMIRIHRWPASKKLTGK